jgi:heme exporter protein C
MDGFRVNQALQMYTLTSEPMKPRVFSSLVVVVLMCVAGYAALFIAPDERTMHDAQRIFYFHVPSWVAMFVAFFVSVFGNIAYIATRSQRYDWLGVAGAEVGVVCCTIGLITGPLWGKPAWGIWWTWDARLTTTFVLWLLYIAYLLLRSMIEETDRRARVSAVFGIFAFLDVPLVYVSNRFWRTQHPTPVFFGGPNAGVDPAMGKVLLLCLVALVGVMTVLLVDRYYLERLRHEVGLLTSEIESRDLDKQSHMSRRPL